jgi:hypothetical protein
MESSSPLSLWFLGLVVSLCLRSGVAWEETIGYGYRLIALEEKKTSSQYGPDIPNLRLFVK